MKDYIVRATAANGQVRAFAAITTETSRGSQTAPWNKPGCDSSAWTSADSRYDDGKYDEE